MSDFQDTLTIDAHITSPFGLFVFAMEIQVSQEEGMPYEINTMAPINKAPTDLPEHYADIIHDQLVDHVEGMIRASYSSVQVPELYFSYNESVGLEEVEEGPVGKKVWLLIESRNGVLVEFIPSFSTEEEAKATFTKALTNLGVSDEEIQEYWDKDGFDDDNGYDLWVRTTEVKE